jgi:hypothetical protein
MVERFIVVVLALFGTAKRLPQILRGAFAVRAHQLPVPSYSETVRRVRGEKAQRRAAERKARAGADQ